MQKINERRVVAFYFIIAVAMFLVALRVINVAFDPRLISVAETSSIKAVSISLQRGTIFDCNMKPLTNNKTKYVSVITDIPSASVTLCDRLGEQRAAALLKEVREGGVPIIYTDIDVSGRGISCFSYSSTDYLLAHHLIGYKDSNGRGVAGLEKALDEILFSESEVRLIFRSDGLGNIIKGEEISFSYDRTIPDSGVMLTIDSDIQRVAEEAAQGIECGAVVVTEIKTGEIKAIVSRPDYDVNDLAQAITDENSPLLNRAFMTYNVGSGFKPCVAAAAIESGIKNYLWFCGGSCDIDGQRFVCHKSSGHKWLDMAGAIKHSCNTFFYNLAIETGAEKIYRMARNAGFANSVNLGYGIFASENRIGDERWLKMSDRALANLAIGQGELMVSPVAILNLYSAIASDGSYIPPSLIKGRVEGLELTETDDERAAVRLMSSETAGRLRECLLGVLDPNGTGYIAKPKTVSAAGKTSTAQTGIIKDGKRVVNTWFCGFFPFNEPKYAVAVLSENSEKGCGDVFAEIADNITKLKASE